MDCFKSNGTEITDSRTPGQFKIIKTYDKIDLNITKGSEFKVEVVAGKNVIKNIKTKVADGILTIDNNNKCNFVRGYKRKVTVNVTSPYLVRVENHGVGTTTFSEGLCAGYDTIACRKLWRYYITRYFQSGKNKFTR